MSKAQKLAQVRVTLEVGNVYNDLCYWMRRKLLLNTKLGHIILRVATRLHQRNGWVLTRRKIRYSPGKSGIAREISCTTRKKFGTEGKKSVPGGWAGRSGLDRAGRGRAGWGRPGWGHAGGGGRAGRRGCRAGQTVGSPGGWVELSCWYIKSFVGLG